MASFSNSRKKTTHFLGNGGMWYSIKWVGVMCISGWNAGPTPWLSQISGYRYLKIKKTEKIIQNLTILKLNYIRQNECIIPYKCYIRNLRYHILYSPCLFFKKKKKIFFWQFHVPPPLGKIFDFLFWSFFEISLVGNNGVYNVYK